jgi:hypothetical protein
MKNRVFKLSNKFYFFRYLVDTPTDVLVFNYEGAKYCECGSRLREYFKQVRSHLYCVSCKHF